MPYGAMEIGDVNDGNSAGNFDDDNDDDDSKSVLFISYY